MVETFLTMGWSGVSSAGLDPGLVSGRNGRKILLRALLIAVVAAAASGATHRLAVLVSSPPFRRLVGFSAVHDQQCATCDLVAGLLSPKRVAGFWHTPLAAS